MAKKKTVMSQVMKKLSGMTGISEEGGEKTDDSENESVHKKKQKAKTIFSK